MNRRHMLKLVGVGGCGAATLLAGRSLFRHVGTRSSSGDTIPPKSRFGLFDVDCRELNMAGNGLDFRPRVQPLIDPLNRLYGLSEEHRLPLVFTVCCSGRVLPRYGLGDILTVPLDPSQQRWQEELYDHRMFYLEKKACDTAGDNFTCRAFDMFRHNGNATCLSQSLGVEEWIVFGNGFDLCIYSAVQGLLAAGQKVCLLTDVFARGARGYYTDTPQGRFENGTPENLERILAEFRELGVRMATLDEFTTSLVSIAV
jgi:nicotinamidase-related amidase